MKTETIHTIQSESVKEALHRLEEKGFWLRLEGWQPRARDVRRARRRAKEREREARRSSPTVVERKRSYERRKKATLRGKYNHLKNAHKRTGLGFMSWDEWQLMWRRAGTILRGDGSEQLAWKARGRALGWEEETDCVQLRRWDTAKAWDLENTYVQHRGNILVDGYELAKEIKELENSLQISEEST